MGVFRNAQIGHPNIVRQHFEPFRMRTSLFSRNYCSILLSFISVLRRITIVTFWRNYATLSRVVNANAGIKTLLRHANCG